jgi:hypothetical protein
MPYKLVVEVRDGQEGYGPEGVVSTFAVDSEFETEWEEQGFSNEQEALDDDILEDWGNMTLESYAPDYNVAGSVYYCLSGEVVDEIPEGLTIFHEDAEGSIVERDKFEKYLLDVVLQIRKKQGVGS